MLKRTNLFLIQVSLAAALAFAEPAKADEYHVFMTVSCLPSIGFFAIQTHGVYNPGDGVIESDANALTTAKLERQPYSCSLSDHITITVKGFCRSQMIPEEVRCSPGRGPTVEEIAIYANDEILGLTDGGSTRTSESTNWLSFGVGRGLVRESVEIPVASYIFGLDVLQCFSPEGYPLRYLENATRAPLATQCRSFKQILRTK
jgi:hypothetical protein